MKVLVEFDDRRAKFFLELLRSIRAIKVRALSSKDQQILDDLRDSVAEVKRSEAGKHKLKSARDFPNGI